MMRLTIEQKQTMKIVMTQELQQAIGLLQMSTYELFQFIQEKAEENPFIEFVDHDQQEMTGVRDGYQNHVPSQHNPLDAVSEKDKSMHDQLLEQTLFLRLSEEEETWIRYLILNIDEKGFLRLTDNEIAESFSVSEKEASEFREILSSLEPCGIGAKDLEECLLWQAKRAFPEDVLLHCIIKQYLPALANKQWNEIAEDLGISLENIINAYEKIQTFDPRPASSFGTEAGYVTPDLSVQWNEEKSMYMVRLHEHYLPKLAFNRGYASRLPKSEATSQFVKERMKQFEWLEQGIQKRRETIMKIMHVLLHRQKDFFRKGLRGLKPLTLNDIAEEIDMHESTVSRATANKSIETANGIFEMKQLFSTRLKTADGEGTSQTKVKEMIRELVQEENKAKPLSDQKIVDQLAKNSIEISRRTVAKYRESMQIASSSKRKLIK